MNKLELNDVSYLYGKDTPFEKQALLHVSVGFEAGKITGLIGHTGSGKSTLVNLLNGLYKPTAGKVLLDGHDIWEKPKEISRIRFRVGLVMQYPEYQLFDDTVRLDIGFAPRNLGLSDSEIEYRVKEAAKFTGLSDDILDKSPFELSGGQKRRVAIAGVLAMRPEVLVLDEPAAGLDPVGKKMIFDGLCAFAKESGTTVILVSHSMEDMAKYCDNIVIMNHGTVCKSGSVRDIFADPSILPENGLLIPEPMKIALALKDAGVNLTGDCYSLRGLYEAILRYREENV